MSLTSKRYRFPLISKDTYNALTEDEREQVVGDLWKKAKERLDRRIEEEGIVHFEPILQIDPRSLAPFQLTKFDSLRLHQALVNTSESSEALDLCMTAMVAEGWVTYSPKLHKWEWHVPNDYPKAIVDLLYRKGLIDSKQAFISVYISQTGTPMNLKRTTITEGNNVRKLVMDLLNPILRYSSSKFLQQPESALTQAPSPLHSRQNSA